MINNGQNYKKGARQRLGSVDGFVASRKRFQNRRPIATRPAINRAPMTPVTRPAIEIRRPDRPSKSIPSTALQSGLSLLNTNLASPNYRHKFEPPKNIHKKFKRKKLILSSVLIMLVMFISVGSWVGWKAVRNVDKVFHGNLVTDAHALFSSTKLKGESNGRVNILLAGDSADDPGHNGANLTDSIMLISLDTKNNTGFMLSIPRDLWINIPRIGHQKINAANTVTNFNKAGYPQGGMGQLEQIVEQDLGIPVDYYGLINYGALKDSVNAVGGITVNIQSPDPRGLYDPNISKQDDGPLKLPNGPVTLNGQTALNLARARGDAYNSYGFPQSDFDRTEHQRQMLVALAQKAETAGVIANPIKIGQLFDALGNNVQTDLKLSDVIRLVQLTKGVSSSNIQSLAISYSGANPLLRSYLAPDGEDALIPAAGVDDFSGIQQYYQKLTSDSPVAKESANVVILNASDVIGLASREKTVLENKGFNVTDIADASTTYPTSTIVDLSNGQDPNSKQTLEQVLSGSTVTTATNSSPEAAEAVSYEVAPYSANFVVVLGTNWDNTP